MEKLDTDLQNRVWQRVQGKNPAPTPEKLNLKPWMLAAQQNGAAYQSLLRSFGGREGEQLKRLQTESGRCVACMKGLCRLRGEKVKTMPLPQSRDNPRQLLEKCYHRERNLWQQLEQHSGDPEHGIVFARLAQQAKEHCVTIMEILGRME